MAGLQKIGRGIGVWRTGTSSRKARQGFTIVEVMVVMAVTGALFAAAAITISGRQNQAGFQEAVQQIQQQVQQVMNDVVSGYFPNNANFQCSATDGGPVVLSKVAPNGQGQNAGCIFAGKVLQVQDGIADPQQFSVYTIAGAQKDSLGQEAGSLAAAAPKLVAAGTAAPANFPDISTDDLLHNGLNTSANVPSGHPRMWYNNGASDIAIGAVAFVPSFAQYSAGNISSGTQQLSVYAIPSTSLGMAKAAMVDAVNTYLGTAIQNPTNGVFICYASGGTNQSGLVTIGGGNRALSVVLKIMDGTTTCGK